MYRRVLWGAVLGAHPQAHGEEVSGGRASSLSSAQQAGTEASPPRGGRCRDRGSAGPQGPLGPAASPLPSRPAAAPTSAQEIRPPGGGPASTRRGVRRARRAEGGPGPCGRGVQLGAAVGASAAPSHQRRGAAEAARMPAPPLEVQPRRRQTSQSLGKEPAAACEAEGSDVRRTGRGGTPPPHPTASRRACAGALFRPPSLSRLGFSGCLWVTCQAPAKERTELRVPGGELLSLAGARCTICGGRRLQYSDGSGVLSSAGRWAAPARPGQRLTAARDSAAARGKDGDKGTGADLRVGVKP